MGLNENSFTPSEYILLNGDRFAPMVDDGGHQLLCSDGMVNGNHLAVMITAAAILANVEENALEIEVRIKKGGLFTTPKEALYIHPVGQTPSWNGYTLESAILFTSGQFYAVKGEYTVRNVVHTILQEDRKEPWQKIIEFVEWGLATSNWLIPVEGDAATAFQTPFICPEKVQELAFSQPEAPIKQLFSDYKRNTPETWKMLLAEINQALIDRRV